MDRNDLFKNEIKKALPSLKKFARSQRSPHLRDFEDLIQDTLEYALNNSGQYKAGTDMGKWLVAICYNLSRNVMRKEQNRSRYLVSDNDADTPALPNQDDAVLFNTATKLVDRLPIEQKSVFYLVCYDGMSYKDAAEVLNLNVGTVKSRISRARAEILAGLELEEAKKSNHNIKNEPSM